MLGQPSLQYSTRLRLFLALLFTNYKSRRVQVHNSLGSIPIYKSFSNASGASAYVNIAVEVLIAAILAMITTLIGVQLIGPVATAVGGALKNGNLTGAANSVTAQLTLLFVVVIVLVPIVFIAVFGKIVSAEAS
jgi:hypothetical protein